MNSSSTTPPALLPQADTPEPDVMAPIRGLGGTIEALLRRPQGVLHHLHEPGAARIIGVMFVLVLFGAAAYGFVVGTFSGGTQLWAAPLKVALGLLLCSVICLPSLYVFACLTGATARFGDVAGMVMGMAALMVLLLISFAPVAWVFSQSTESITAMGTLHLVFWLIATYFGARFLYRGMSRLGARGEGAFYFWICLFVVVALQMTTALRPIVGSADTFLPAEKKFFLQHWREHVDGPVATR
ncbi:MAG TPA: hypothetical protein PLX89_20430 [Verrucomicrobiota bacterium]|nr:hypothetical protein [Verrucomicrobiales bacterium]HRI15369.1 hypothetical protein [Verrucomicrobiota bacterium]